MDNGNGISDYDSRVLHYYVLLHALPICCSILARLYSLFSLAQHQYGISTGGVPRADARGAGRGSRRGVYG